MPVKKLNAGKKSDKKKSGQPKSEVKQRTRMKAHRKQGDSKGEHDLK